MEYVKCKACGYIMEASKVGDKCPACGVPAKQFEPYIERIKENRLRILKLHAHPVIVHMPQAFAASLVLLPLVLYALGSGAVYDALYSTTLVLALALPVSVFGAFAAGVLDAKIRFRRVSAPLLVKKMVVGVAFLVLSALGAGAAFALGLHGMAPLCAFFVLEAAGLACGSILGIWGAGLNNAAFPG